MLKVDDGPAEVNWMRTQRLSSGLVQTLSSKPGFGGVLTKRCGARVEPGRQEEEPASGCVVSLLAERPRQHLESNVSPSS